MSRETPTTEELEKSTRRLEEATEALLRGFYCEYRLRAKYGVPVEWEWSGPREGCRHEV